MLTVPQAAERVGRDPETVRRWIRAGALRSQKIGTQHLVDESDLTALVERGESLPMLEGWKRTRSGAPQPDWVAILRRSRQGH